MITGRDEFRFALGEDVLITVSGETGTVIAQCRYQAYGDRYLLRYRTAAGEAVERWWDVDALDVRVRGGFGAKLEKLFGPGARAV